MSKTHKSSFSLQNYFFRFKFFFDQNLDFVLGLLPIREINEEDGLLSELSISSGDSEDEYVEGENLDDFWAVVHGWRKISP